MVLTCWSTERQHSFETFHMWTSCILQICIVNKWIFLVKKHTIYRNLFCLKSLKIRNCNSCANFDTEFRTEPIWWSYSKTCGIGWVVGFWFKQAFSQFWTSLLQKFKRLTEFAYVYMFKFGKAKHVIPALPYL